MSRAVVAFPGRGAYAPSSLRSLPAGHRWVKRAAELRRAENLPSLIELDRAARFDPHEHLRPANASVMTFLIGMLDAERIAGDHEVVAVVGDSVGWYTALAAAGALSFDDALRLVQQMALLHEQPIPEDGPGGQVIYPLTDATWKPDPSLAAAARQQLGDLAWQAPRVTLIDGRGARFTPWSTDPAALASYTLEEQVVSPYRFATALRVALREYSPDVVVLPRPGTSLGGICGQVVVAEGFRGVRSRAGFEQIQAGRKPILLSMRR